MWQKCNNRSIFNADIKRTGDKIETIECFSKRNMDECSSGMRWQLMLHAFIHFTSCWCICYCEHNLNCLIDTPETNECCLCFCVCENSPTSWFPSSLTNFNNYYISCYERWLLLRFEQQLHQRKKGERTKWAERVCVRLVRWFTYCRFFFHSCQSAL